MSWTHCNNRTRDRSKGRSENRPGETSECDSLEHADDGRSGGHRQVQRPADLTRAGPKATSGRDIQGKSRSSLRRKLEAIVELYLDPSKHGLVLCCDEKSQI